MRKLITSISSPVLMLIGTPAMAHPGHPTTTDGFTAGLLHPWSGADHLLAMMLVGLWAAQLGKRATWAVPASFFVLMASGAALALAGIAPSHVQAGIAASLVILGLLVTVAGKLSTPLAMALVGTFAVFHGAAHVQEAADAAFATYALGFLISTAALHGVGAIIGFGKNIPAQTLARVLGAASAIVGLGMAVA
jgi:urease accessory protein